jgi:hypothetical protein
MISIMYLAKMGVEKEGKDGVYLEFKSNKFTALVFKNDKVPGYTHIIKLYPKSSLMYSRRGTGYVRSYGNGYRKLTRYSGYNK